LTITISSYATSNIAHHMGFSAYFKKAALAASLLRGRSITLGDNTYRIKGFFINSLALKDRTELREPWLDAVYQTVLRCRKGAFLDVGANLGQTMFKILSLDSSRQYIGFEPQVSCCFPIQQFLEENHIGNYAILPVGLSNKNGTVKLYLREGGFDSTASMVKDFRPESFYASHRYVCVRKGDELISELQVTSVSAIKIDVEGAELEVIEGLLDLIGAKIPFIIFEVLNHFVLVTGDKLDDQHIRFRESRIEKMEDILRQRDYVILNVLPGNCLKKVRRIVPPISADLSVTNYIAVSKLDLDSFLRVFPGSVSDS
jgi:FkbM family methyltransferase